MSNNIQAEKLEGKITLQLLDGQDREIAHWDLQGKNAYCLGRGADNDVTLHYSWVSRKHAIVQVEENLIHNLIDLGSSNGTFVNGRRIYTPVPLRTGDVVGIGSTRLVFRQERILTVEPVAEPDDFDEKTVAFIRKGKVTLLICDIHEFTRLSEQLDSDLVSELLRVWTVRADGIVRARGGQVDKFIGDAVMAVWSGGEAMDGTVIRQVMSAAHEINLLTEELGARMLPGLTGKLQIGAAVNTGEAVMGNMGVDGQRDYTVIGDVVNVAFRLEGLTSREKGLDLLLGEEAAVLLDGLAPFFNQIRCRVRGKSAPLLAYGCSFDRLQAYLQAGEK